MTTSPTTIPAFLHDIVERFGGDEALVLGERRESFRSLERASALLARGLLAAGVGKGTRVGVLFPNGPDWARCFLAATRVGAVAVPLNTFQRSRELAWTLRHADVDTLLSVDRFLGNDYVALLEAALPELAGAGSPLHLSGAPYLRRIFVAGERRPAWAGALSELDADPRLDDAFLRAVQDEVSPADTLMIVYTSGSTAEPKGVVHSHGAVVRHAALMAQARGLRGDDRVWLPMPLFWIGGVVFGLLADLHAGAATIFEERFDAGATLALLERERVSVLTGWPHTVQALQEHPDFGRRDLSSVRDGDLRDALRVWPRDPEQRASPLGMTETCGPHSFDDISRDLPESLRGCAGRSVPEMQHVLVDPESGERVPEGATGEIWVRGRSLMQGLYKREREEVFDADGFYHTGDLGRFGEGRLFFAGRLGDMIKTAGANVSPREVELALLETPELSEAYVVGVPDAALGQIVAAAVVTKPGLSLAPEEVARALRERLSAYKIPRLVALYGEGQLPYRANGKIDRAALTALLASRWKERPAKAS